MTFCLSVDDLEDFEHFIVRVISILTLTCVNLPSLIIWVLMEFSSVINLYSEVLSLIGDFHVSDNVFNRLLINDPVFHRSCGSEVPPMSSELGASEVDLRGWFPSELISGLRIRIDVLLGSDFAYLSDIKRCLHLWNIHLSTSLDIPIFRFRISNVLQILSFDYDSDTDVVQILSSNSKHISWYSLIDNFALTIWACC